MTRGSFSRIRALLNMRLESRLRSLHAALQCPAKPMACKASRTADALAVACTQGMFQTESAPANTPDPIITGTKREPSSLVHTHTSIGRLGCECRWSLQGAQHLEPGQHAKVAVKLAAGGLGVDMDCPWPPACAGRPRALRDAQTGCQSHPSLRRATGLTSPRSMKLVASHPVQFGQGKATHTPPLSVAPMVGEAHQTVPEPLRAGFAVRGMGSCQRPLRNLSI